MLLQGGESLKSASFPRGLMNFFIRKQHWDTLNFPCQLQQKSYQLHPLGYHRYKRSENSFCQWEKCDVCNVLSSDLNAIRWLTQQSSRQTARKILLLDGNCDRTDCSFHPLRKTLLSSQPSTRASIFTSRSFSPLVCWLWRGWFPPPMRPALIPALFIGRKGLILEPNT